VWLGRRNGKRAAQRHVAQLPPSQCSPNSDYTGDVSKADTFEARLSAIQTRSDQFCARPVGDRRAANHTKLGSSDAGLQPGGSLARQFRLLQNSAQSARIGLFYRERSLWGNWMACGKITVEGIWQVLP
jgi:hypothetical protein